MSAELSGRPPSAARFALPALLLVSGFCGISYEILYTKFLGNLLGNQFTISASVLLTFLAGIGLGTLYAHRFVRHLWAVEAGIGVYAALMVLSYGWIDRLIYAQIPVLGTSLLICALVSIVLLAVPAFLVGCSVPLFAAYLSTLRSTHVFSLTYAIYNVGAGLTALVMEFLLLRAVGLHSATLLLALLNAGVAAGLLVLVRRAPVIPAPRTDRMSFRGRDLSALVLASVASAIFQLMMIKIAECVIGPFNETFALVLATVLLGLAFGSFAAGQWGLTFRGALVLAGCGVTLLILLHPTIVTVYAALYDRTVDVYPALVLAKLALVAAFMALPAIGFGATVPSLLRVHRDVARESGFLLFVSSMANVLGFVLMAFVLHRYLDYGPLLVIVVGLTAAALWIHGGFRLRPALGAAALLAVALAGQQFVWQEILLYYGHHSFKSPAKLRRARESQVFAEKFKGYQDVFAITHVNGQPSFFINGYVSIPLTAAAEKVAGALSVMYAPRRDEALVLGVGSGATAGTVGLMFDHTEAVEINAVILQNLHRMSEYNFDLENQPRTQIVHDDGIHYIKTATKKYSLIVNTVTTPIYFSSSKLYTRDFLDHVVERLTPDGVYTTWVDQDLGDRGVDIILETLDDAFEQCWVNFLKSSYYLVCSNSEIEPQQVEVVRENPELTEYFARIEALPARFVHYSALAKDALEIVRPQDTPINTLDFPVLEHHMAQLSTKKIYEFNDRLAERIDLRRVRGHFWRRAVPWDPAEFAVWRDLRMSRGASLHEILSDVVERQFGDVSERYARISRDLAAGFESAEGYYRYGSLFYKTKRYDAAAELLQKALEYEPEMPRAHYRLGRVRWRQGRLDEAREHFVLGLEGEVTRRNSRKALAILDELAAGGDAGSDDDDDDEDDEGEGEGADGQRGS